MTLQLDGISSMATRQILADLAGAYERRSGRRVAIRSMGGVEAARLVRAGETVDVVILASQAMEQLEAEGHLVRGSRVDLARSEIAVAVRAGAPRPDLANEASVRDAMLKAARICYSTGPSGEHLKALWRRWGIAETIAPRALQAPPAVPVGEIVARGEAELGLQQLSELLGLPGIDIVGPLPPAVQAVTVFSAGIGILSSQAEEARALIAFLASPEAAATKRKHGMEPAWRGPRATAEPRSAT